MQPSSLAPLFYAWGKCHQEELIKSFIAISSVVPPDLFASIVASHYEYFSLFFCFVFVFCCYSLKCRSGHLTVILDSPLHTRNNSCVHKGLQVLALHASLILFQTFLAHRPAAVTFPPDSLPSPAAGQWHSPSFSSFYLINAYVFQISVLCQFLRKIFLYLPVNQPL